ncbi:uncharacterized protein LOC144160707 [Haemaphysalis longicornis]
MATTEGQHSTASLPPEDNVLLNEHDPPAIKKRAIEELQRHTTGDGHAAEEESQAAFTVVRYKKSRPTDIPVVIQPTQPGCSFWRLNPNLLASAVVSIAQEKVLTHRFNKDGGLVVTVSTLNAANRLLAVTELVGMTVQARLPRSYSATCGKIDDVPLEYTDEELLSYLRDQGVTSAKRQVSYDRGENGVVAERRRKTVLLEFPNGSALPKRIFLGFCSYPVEEYLGTATQCFKCQRHGHIAKYCNGPVRCKICAGPHSYKDCTSRAHPRCANCDGPHPATFGACPQKKAATLARAVDSLASTHCVRAQAIVPAEPWGASEASGDLEEFVLAGVLPVALEADFAARFREELLPPDYDFRILRELAARTQHLPEGVLEYIPAIQELLE